MTKKRVSRIPITNPIGNERALSAPGRIGKKPNIVDTRSSNSIEIDYFRFYESLLRKEVQDWQHARALRRDPFNPSTYHIQQLYKDAMLDNHLQGAIENRILRVINKEPVFKDAEGVIDRKRSAFIQTRWFRHIVRKAMESLFYEYSLCFISEATEGNIRKVIDLPRENVVPEKGLLLKNAMLPQGENIPYNAFPDTLIYIQIRPGVGGILERLAPLTIYKRHSWASWDMLEQIWGIPLRIAKTAIQTKQHKDDLQNWLQRMGSASYAILDKQTDIEIKEPAKGDPYNIFLQKIIIVNKEMSKGVNGQTMTMDDGSSNSQAQVHQKTYDEITNSDIMEIQDWTTDDFIPVMRNLGYDIPEGYYIQLLEKEIIKPLDKIKIDQALMQGGFNLDPDYVEQFYGTTLNKENPIRVPSNKKLNHKKNDLSFFD